MEDGLIRLLTQRGVSLIRIDKADWEAISQTVRGNCTFSITVPHQIAQNAKSGTPCIIAPFDSDRRRLFLGITRSVIATATLDTRVKVELVRKIEPNYLDSLLDLILQPQLRSYAEALKNGDAKVKAISKKLGEAVIRQIAEFESNWPILRILASQMTRPKNYNNARALQQGALELAIQTFGGRKDLSPKLLELSGEETAPTGLRLLEDTVIEHDARWVPGWELSDSDCTGRAVFTRSDEQLEIYTANKLPLEELFGVDLIYLNRKRSSIVMVQYKMMDPGAKKMVPLDGIYSGRVAEEKEWIVRIDKQFSDEMCRMKRFDQRLSTVGPYRLHDGPFYFKLVKRDAAIGSAGLVLSLGHLEKLIENGSALGPRGGLRLTYRGLDGHYLRSVPFIEMIRSGYIGARGATTVHFQTLIKEALVGGRAAVAAMTSALEPRSASLDL